MSKRHWVAILLCLLCLVAFSGCKYISRTVESSRSTDKLEDQVIINAHFIQQKNVVVTQNKGSALEKILQTRLDGTQSSWKTADDFVFQSDNVKDYLVEISRCENEINPSICARLLTYFWMYIIQETYDMDIWKAMSITEIDTPDDIFKKIKSGEILNEIELSRLTDFYTQVKEFISSLEVREYRDGNTVVYQIVSAGEYAEKQLEKRCEQEKKLPDVMNSFINNSKGKSAAALLKSYREYAKNLPVYDGSSKVAFVKSMNDVADGVSFGASPLYYMIWGIYALNLSTYKPIKDAVVAYIEKHPSESQINLQDGELEGVRNEITTLYMDIMDGVNPIDLMFMLMTVHVSNDETGSLDKKNGDNAADDQKIRLTSCEQLEKLRAEKEQGAAESANDGKSRMDSIKEGLDHAADELSEHLNKEAEFLNRAMEGAKEGVREKAVEANEYLEGMKNVFQRP